MPKKRKLTSGAKRSLESFLGDTSGPLHRLRTAFGNYFVESEPIIKDIEEMIRRQQEVAVRLRTVKGYGESGSK